MPANYAPPNIAPMAYNDSAGGNNVAAAGGFAAPPNNAAPANAAGSPWQETSAYPTAPYNPNMDLSRDPVSSVRSGGMPINDLTTRILRASGLYASRRSDQHAGRPFARLHAPTQLSATAGKQLAATGTISCHLLSAIAEHGYRRMGAT